MIESGAVITGDYRYLLWREWDSDRTLDSRYNGGNLRNALSRKTVAFIMLNPNSADAQIKDPTITRCINFAKAWGYGRLEVVNFSINDNNFWSL